MNGMEAYVSQNVSPHEGIVGESGVVPPIAYAAAAQPPTQQQPTQVTSHVVSPVAAAAAYAQTRLLVNGAHSKKMEN